MLPLSFKEFCYGLPNSEQKMSKAEKFNQYVEIGSFPLIAQFADRKQEAKEYLRDVRILYCSKMLLRDLRSPIFKILRTLRIFCSTILESGLP